MHEMSVTMSLLDLILDEAAKAGASKISGVNIVLGEMTGIIDRYVQANFELLSQNTPAEGAALSFRNIPRQARCRHCGHAFQPSDFEWNCPECQSLEMEITGGNELYVESIEVE
ncbi:MAG: hydrogenase maturation nickel metallochaperone HypA [Dehalococcoidales bacterium]